MHLPAGTMLLLELLIATTTFASALPRRSETPVLTQQQQQPYRHYAAEEPTISSSFPSSPSEPAPIPQQKLESANITLCHLSECIQQPVSLKPFQNLVISDIESFISSDHDISSFNIPTGIRCEFFRTADCTARLGYERRDESFCNRGEGQSVPQFFMRESKEQAGEEGIQCIRCGAAEDYESDGWSCYDPAVAEKWA